MPPWRQVHREIDVPSQRSEPGGMETAYGGDVASHGANGKVFMATVSGFLDDPADEHAANASIPSYRSDNYRLDFSARTAVEQTGQTDDPALRLGHPGSHPPRLREVVIESRPGIVSTNRSVPVNTSMVLSQLR